MGNLYDGTAVFAPVAGATALAADQVSLQAALILGLQGRWRDIPLASGMPGDAAGWAITWNTGGAPYCIWSSTTANAELLFPVPCRDDEYITDAAVWISSTAGNPTGGNIKLYSVPYAGGAVVSQTDFGCAGNFWDTDGAIDHLTDAGINRALDCETYHHIIEVKGPAVTDATTATLYGLAIKTRFHEGP